MHFSNLTKRRVAATGAYEKTSDWACWGLVNQSMTALQSAHTILHSGDGVSPRFGLR
jgi:hypothetical protein